MADESTTARLDTSSPPATDGAALATVPRGRASWSGLLRLSLLTFPVKAYPVALTAQEIPLNQLHAGCGQRIRYEKHCPVHGQVDSGAIARGYQYAPDQYLTLDEAELDGLRPAKDKALTLERCVAPGQIDPLLYSGRSLYLLPDGAAAQRPYALLSQALQEHGKWVLGRVVFSSHRHVVLVRPTGRVLTLQVLQYPAQLRGSAPLEGEIVSNAISAEESKLAGMLLDACAVGKVAWAEYQDDTAQSLRALVEAKLQGRTPPVTSTAEAPVLQLLDALKASVAQALQHASPTEGAVKEKSRKRPAPRKSA